jgi:hypothetical protein
MTLRRSAAVQQYLSRLSAQPISNRDRQRLTKLMSFCDSLPDVEMTPVGERHLALKTRRRTFAYYLNDHHGDGRVCICCKSTHVRRQELMTRDPERFYIPAYLGAKGWVSLRLDSTRVDWNGVFELLTEAFHLQVPRSSRRRGVRNQEGLA